MEITNFGPLIMTNDSESIQQLFEELGSTKRHEKKHVTENKDGGFRMKDEAIGILESHGFKNMSGDGKVIDTGSSKTAIMIAPSGFAINVVYHIRK